MGTRHRNGSSADDVELAAAAERALADLGATRVRATAARGVVTLVGEIDFATTREEVAVAVRELRGVREVRLTVAVKRPLVLAQEVRHAVAGALQRHAEREARHIELEVREGDVELRGRVGSTAERALVLGAVRGVRGVHAIEDRLTVG